MLNSSPTYSAGQSALFSRVLVNHWTCVAAMHPEFVINNTTLLHCILSWAELLGEQRLWTIQRISLDSLHCRSGSALAALCSGGGGGALLKDSNLRFTPFWNLFYSCQWQWTKYLTLAIYKSSLRVPRFWKFKGYNAGISSTLVSSQWWTASERTECGQEGMVTWHVLLTHLRVNREG